MSCETRKRDGADDVERRPVASRKTEVFELVPVKAQAGSISVTAVSPSGYRQAVAMGPGAGRICGVNSGTLTVPRVPAIRQISIVGVAGNAAAGTSALADTPGPSAVPLIKRASHGRSGPRVKVPRASMIVKSAADSGNGARLLFTIRIANELPTTNGPCTAHAKLIDPV